MTEPYEERTLGWIILALLVPVQMIVLYLYLNQIGERPIDLLALLLFELLTLAVVLLFYRLRTRVTADTIKVSFGIGLIRKTIDMKRVKKVERVTTPWYYGWGIRYIPNGTLYNMSGSDGVELTFVDTDRIVRIGSGDGMRLKSEIENRLTSRRLDQD